MITFHLTWNEYDWIGVAMLALAVALRVRFGPLKSDSPLSWRIASAIAYVLPLVAIVALIGWHGAWPFMDRGMVVFSLICPFFGCWNLFKDSVKSGRIHLIHVFDTFLLWTAFFTLALWMPRPVPLITWSGLCLWLLYSLADLLCRYRTDPLLRADRASKAQGISP